MNLFLHRGNKYSCPFCQYSSKDLSPIGIESPAIKEKGIIGGGKRNGGCYKCGSTDRERLVYIFLRSKLNLFQSPGNKKILHIAPEKNLSKVLLASGFEEYICGDLFMEGYDYPAHVQNMNILKIPFTDNYFDLIICNHVLEHIPNDMDAMKELNRVLKKGGQAILQVPISKNTYRSFEDFSITEPKERELVFGQADHIRVYGQDYIERLTRSGFEIRRINISGEFPGAGLIEDEDIFFATK